MRKTAIPVLAVCFLLTAEVAADDVWPLPTWPKAKPAEVGMNPALLQQARDYALTGGGSGHITMFPATRFGRGDCTTV